MTEQEFKLLRRGDRFVFKTDSNYTYTITRVHRKRGLVDIRVFYKQDLIRYIHERKFTETMNHEDYKKIVTIEGFEL